MKDEMGTTEASILFKSFIIYLCNK